MNEWSIDDAAHLLRRAGFGGSSEQVLGLHALGRDAAIDFLLNYERMPDPAAGQAQALLNATGEPPNAAAVVLWLLYRMANTTRPLQEKLAWFWHGHFTSALVKCPPVRMLVQNETWRRHANGSFRVFLKAMYKDPAMLLYLDNNTNVKDAPNENFARELMELFTLGIGYYSETDVKEAARALTGWKVPRNTTLTSVFLPRDHDDGVKTVLGVTGPLDADGVMDILADHAQTARHICTKLYRFFVGTEPQGSDLDALAAEWHATDGHIKALMNRLFHLDAFWSPANRSGLVKSPVEYTIGVLQRFELSDIEALRAVGKNLPAMGQIPLNPPHVAGYPTDLEWVATSPLLARYNTINALLYSRLSRGLIAQLVEGADVTQAAQLVDKLLARMGPFPVSPATRQALVDYVGPQDYRATPAQLATKGRGVLHLIASAPEYQLN